MAKEKKTVNLEELRDYLKTLMPKSAVSKEDEKAADAILDIFNWASER